MSAATPFFDLICDEVEGSSQLSRLQARGAVRLALKEAGIDAQSMSKQESGVVVQRLLPAALERQGVAPGDIERACARITGALGGMTDSAAAAGPDAIFVRLDAARGH